MTAEWEDLSPRASRETTVTTQRYFSYQNYNSNWCKELKASSKHATTHNDLANQRVLCCLLQEGFVTHAARLLHVRDRTRDHVTVSKLWGGLTTGPGRCDVNTELLLPTAKQSKQEVEQVMVSVWSVTSHILSSLAQNESSSRRCCSGCRRLGLCPGQTLCYKLQAPGLKQEITSLNVSLEFFYHAC